MTREFKIMPDEAWEAFAAGRLDVIPSRDENGQPAFEVAYDSIVFDPDKGEVCLIYKTVVLFRHRINLGPKGSGSVLTVNELKGRLTITITPT